MTVNKDDKYYYWPRGTEELLSPHFGTREFNCSCGKCDVQRIAIELVNKIETLREQHKEPIYVTSGYRCRQKQLDLAAQGYETAKGISQHELGHAADLSVNYVPKLAALADKLFDSMGVGKTFIHVDLRPGLRRWTYAKRRT